MNEKNLKNIIWTSGIWSIPFSLTIIVGILKIIGIEETRSESKMIILIVCITIMLIIAIKNRYEYQKYYRDDFSLKAQHAWRKLGFSKEKKEALYQSPKKDNLFEVPEGMVLAKTRKQYVCSPINTKNLLMGCIIGSPGSGKSSGPYISTLAWNFDQMDPITCYVIDIKGELHNKCIKANNPRVKIIDPDNISAAGWDPWYDIVQTSSDDDVIENADKCARAIIVENNEKNAFFSNSARKIFKGVMLFFFRKQVWTNADGEVKSGFADAVFELQSAEIIQLIKRIIDDKEVCSKHPQVGALLGGFINTESEALNGIKLSLEENLDVFSQEKVYNMLSDKNSNRASPIDLNNSISIFMSVKEDKLDVLKPLIRLISYQVLAEMEKRPESSNPVLMVYDEFPRLGKIDRIASALATFRSRNVSMWLAIQDFSQLQAVYGHDVARIILNLCEVCCVLSCRDMETAKILEEWSGKFELQKASHNRNAISKMHSMIENISIERRSVIEMADLMRLRSEKGVALWIEGRYCRARRIRWYEDKLLRPIVEENIRFNTEYSRKYNEINTIKDYFETEFPEPEIVFFDEDDLFDDEKPESEQRNEVSRIEKYYEHIEKWR